MDAMVCAAAVASALASSKIFTVRLSSDRKSTRLNSSHGYISYAVFCLKKKKKHYRATSAIMIQRLQCDGQPLCVSYSAEPLLIGSNFYGYTKSPGPCAIRDGYLCDPES